jgi:hypothetical protein
MKAILRMAFVFSRARQDARQREATALAVADFAIVWSACRPTRVLFGNHKLARGAPLTTGFALLSYLFMLWETWRFLSQPIILII